jgi:sugar-specific transcriptional regulator TrmB
VAKTYAVPQNTQALVRGGLTPTQASIYETLVQQGSLNARRVSFIAGVPRTLGYKILDELERLELIIKKDEPGSVASFTAAHPLKLKKLVARKLHEAEDAKIALDEALSTLVPDFNRVSGHSDTQVLEGVSGLKELLDNTLSQKKPLMTTIVENSATKLTFFIIFEAN